MLALLVAAATLLWVGGERAHLEQIMHEYQAIPYADRYRAAASRYVALSYWPGLLAAAAVGAFGILILAIRPPTRDRRER